MKGILVKPKNAINAISYILQKILEKEITIIEYADINVWSITFIMLVIN